MEVLIKLPVLAEEGGEYEFSAGVKKYYRKKTQCFYL